MLASEVDAELGYAVRTEPAKTQLRPRCDYEATPETRRSLSVTDGRLTTFPNRWFTAPA